MRDYTGSSALRIALYLGMIPLWGEKERHVRCDGDNSNYLSLFTCPTVRYGQILQTKNKQKRWHAGEDCPMTTPQSQEDKKFQQQPRHPLLSLSESTETWLGISTLTV